MKLYKLTDQNGNTRAETNWGENVTHKATGKGTRLCSDGVIHAYDSPLKAALFNPIHGNFKDSLLWESEGDIVVNDHLKVGVKSLTTLRQIPLPEISTEKRVEFAIRCTLKVYPDARWVKWACSWLDGSDRSEAAAWAAARAAEAARAAAWAAA